jgi:hypothetical protein
MWRIPDGMVGRGLFSCLELWAGSPHLCWLRTGRLAPVSKFVLCNDAYGQYGIPQNKKLCRSLSWTIPYHTSWMIEGIVHGPPMDSTECGIPWKTYTRVWWSRLDSLIVIMNCCHSWCPFGSRVSCCQVITLQGLNWLKSLWHPRIWVTLAYCNHSVAILLS